MNWIDKLAQETKYKSRDSRPSGVIARPTVAIYSEPLTGPSWTAVRMQGEALQHFTPVYVTPKKMQAAQELPVARIIAIRESDSALTRFLEIPFKVFRHAPIFFRRVRKFNPVLVNAHFGPCALAALSLSRWLRVPLVTTFHGSDVTTLDGSTYLSRRYFRNRWRLQQQGALFIANSEYIYHILLEQGFPPERLVLNYIGVDTKFFCEDPAIEREPIVLFVGKLEQIKGCEYLIRAMVQVQSEFPTVDLVIIGDGSLRSNLEGMAARLLRRYQFLGFQPAKRVRDWMNRARVFCFPGVQADSGSEEAFGLVIAEALATGLPVVASAVGGVREAVEHGSTGFLVQPGSVSDLVTHICMLLRDQDLWRRLSRKAPKSVQRKFDLQVQTAALERIFAEVCGMSLEAGSTRYATEAAAFEKKAV